LLSTACSPVETGRIEALLARYGGNVAGLLARAWEAGGTPGHPSRCRATRLICTSGRGPATERAMYRMMMTHR
jgi:hypothetical protein